MSNEIKVTASLHEEDRVRIDALIRALHDLAGNGPQITSQVIEAEPTEEMDQDAEKAPQSEPEAAAPWDKDAPDLSGVAEQKYSKEDVQQKVVNLAAAGKKAEVKEIVNAYAERVSAIPEDKLDEVMEKLIALEG